MLFRKEMKSRDDPTKYKCFVAQSMSIALLVAQQKTWLELIIEMRSWMVMKCVFCKNEVKNAKNHESDPSKKCMTEGVKTCKLALLAGNGFQASISTSIQFNLRIHSEIPHSHPESYEIWRAPICNSFQSREKKEPKNCTWVGPGRKAAKVWCEVEPQMLE